MLFLICVTILSTWLLAAVSTQYKTTKAEHSWRCHCWTQGQGICLSLVGGFIWTHPIHVPWLSLLSLNIVSLMIVDVLGRWSEDVFLVSLLYMRSAEPSVHIQFCPYTCIWKLSILWFLGCLGRWSSQAQRQSWEFWKSSTTKSIRYVNVFVSLPSFASNCYCGSVSTVFCFWDGILPIVILNKWTWYVYS
jgi:hypothetical protein